VSGIADRLIEAVETMIYPTAAEAEVEAVRDGAPPGPGRPGG
jgi:hypothetical protein